MKSVRFELDKNELFYIENISEYLMHSSGFLSNLMCKINEIKEMRCCYLNNRNETLVCLLYTSPSPRDQRGSRMPSSA